MMLINYKVIMSQENKSQCGSCLGISQQRKTLLMFCQQFGPPCMYVCVCIYIYIYIYIYINANIYAIYIKYYICIIYILALIYKQPCDVENVHLEAIHKAGPHERGCQSCAFFRYAACGITVRNLNSLLDFIQVREGKQFLSKRFYSFVSLFYNKSQSAYS